MHTISRILQFRRPYILAIKRNISTSNTVNQDTGKYTHEIRFLCSAVLYMVEQMTWTIPKAKKAKIETYVAYGVRVER